MAQSIIPVVSWIINNRCNLRCSHCYTASGRENKPGYSVDDIMIQCENIGSVYPEVIFLSGGEPTLDDHIFDYINMARSVTSKSLWICSNGTAITNDFLSRAKSDGVDGFCISLEHSDSEIEDSISGGSGVLDKVYGALRRIKAADFELNLETTILNQNFDVLDSMIQIGVESEADLVTFKRFRPIGRGKNGHHLAMPRDDYIEVLDYIYRRSVSENRIRIAVHDPLFNVIKRDHHLATITNPLDWNYCSTGSDFGCGAGISWVGVDPFGNVSPCPLLGQAGLVIGNINEQRLDNILSGSREMLLLCNRRSSSSYCPYSRICGGCRAHALAIHGEYWEKDPICFYDQYRCPTTYMSRLVD